jgi:hypothetical protein
MLRRRAWRFIRAGRSGQPASTSVRTKALAEPCLADAELSGIVRSAGGDLEAHIFGQLDTCNIDLSIDRANNNVAIWTRCDESVGHHVSAWLLLHRTAPAPDATREMLPPQAPASRGCALRLTWGGS